METIKITSDEAWEMQQPFLKSAEKKKLGITGYQCLYGWYFELETDMAVKLSGINETGTCADKEQEDVSTWLPKSQIKVFEYTDDDDIKRKLFFVRTWLYNENRSELKLNEFKNFAY